MPSKPLAFAQEHQILEHDIAGGTGGEGAAAEAAERSIQDARTGTERRGAWRCPCRGCRADECRSALSRDLHRAASIRRLASARHSQRCWRSRQYRRRPRRAFRPPQHFPGRPPTIEQPSAIEIAAFTTGLGAGVAQFAEPPDVGDPDCASGRRWPGCAPRSPKPPSPLPRRPRPAPH